MASSRSTKRRIHFISTNPARWGGSEELWHGMALRALEDGHEVLVSVFRHPSPHGKILQLQEKGALLDLRHLPCYHYDQPFLRLTFAQLLDRLNWNIYPMAWRAASGFKADAMLVSSGESLDGYLYEDSFPIRQFLKRKAPCIFLSHFHHEHSKILGTSERKRKIGFLEQASAAFFVSLRNLEMTRNELQHSLPKARIIHNPIQVPEVPDIWHEHSHTIRMAFVARLECEVKCQDLLVQALAHPSFRETDWVLDFFGEGKDRGYLESVVAFHGLSDRIRILGQHPNPMEIWKDHEILVLTSRGEGTPLTLFEAMRSARTAIVTNAGDSALWMAGGRGYVSPAPTVEALRETLRRAMAERPTWSDRGRECRRFFYEKWNPQHSEEIYQSLLGTRSACDIGWDSGSYAQHLGWEV